MSQACQQVVGSRVKVSIVPNLNCSAAPVTHQVVTAAAAAIGDTVLSLKLDSTYTPISGAYTASSKYPLTPGTILAFGSNLVEVTADTAGNGVYFITTTAQNVNVRRLTVAVASAASSNTYFAIQLCLKSSNVTTNTTQIDNTTNCTGSLFTQVNVGYMKMLDLAGFLSSQDYGYYILSTLGRDLQSVFYAIDYDTRFLDSGVAQLTDPSITEAVVKQLAGYTLQAQIQSVDLRYGSYLTVADQAALATTRNLYGLKAASGLVTIV